MLRVMAVTISFAAQILSHTKKPVSITQSATTETPFMLCVIPESLWIVSALPHTAPLKNMKDSADVAKNLLLSIFEPQMFLSTMLNQVKQLSIMAISQSPSIRL